MAQSSWIDWPLNLETWIAAITTSNSAAWLLPATRANAYTMSGAVGLMAALSNSIHRTRCSTNSATGAGSPKCSWRDGQSTTTRLRSMLSSCSSQQRQDPIGLARKQPIAELVAGDHNGRPESAWM